MNDMKRTRRRLNVPRDKSQTQMRASARQAELHALEEQFLSEQRAGSHPRLSTYVRHYPDFGAELAAFIALAFIPDSQAGVLLLADDGDVAPRDLRATLSPGTQRALEEIFGSDEGETISGRSQVAERRAGYVSEAAHSGSEGNEGEQEP